MNMGTDTGAVQDGQGGEYKVVNGREHVALWLPMMREEKAAQPEKAAREGVNVSELVAEHLRAWTSR